VAKMNVEHEVTLLIQEIRRLGSISKSCTILDQHHCFFYWTQKKMFLRMSVIKHMTVTI